MSIVLNSKTYNFRGFQAPTNFSLYLETSGGVPSSFSNLTAKVTDGGAKANTQVRWKLKVPTVQTEADACSCPGTVLDDTTVDIVITMGPSVTAAKRADVLARLQALVLKTEFTVSVTDLVQPSA
jgi:hypothetical protein